MDIPIVSAVIDQQESQAAPVAKKVSHVAVVHNQELVDNYHWLRDYNWPKVEDKAVLDYLKQENNYYASVMGGFKAQEDKIFQELVGRIKLTDQTVPVKKGNYLYYSRTNQDSNYNIYCRKKAADQPEEVMLDVNNIAKGKAFFDIESISVSPDHTKLLYSTDETGGERYKVVIKDLITGELLADSVENTIGEVVWHENGQGFFYGKLNDAWRVEEVFYHKLGTDSSQDQLIVKDDNQLFRLSVSKSEDRRFILITSSSKDSNETWFIDTKSADLTPKLLLKRQKNHLYYPDHHDGSFYIMTNDRGKNFRLVKTPLDHTDQRNWQEVIAHSDASYLTAVHLFQNCFVVTHKEAGLPLLRIYDYGMKHSPKEIKFPDPSYTASAVYTTYEDSALRISYSSLNTPGSIMEYDFTSGEMKVLKVTEIPSGYNKDLYISKRVFAETKDGIKVPVSLVYRTDLFKQDGSNPLYLYGYGSYGYAVPPSFRTSVISLLDRGFVYAIAHIRGGDDMGYDWYEGAKFLTKKRTFEDFIAASEHLIKEKYSSKGNIMIAGGSAGGMLMGVVLNERPELYKAAAAHVPFVDVLNTMLDETLPLTPGEFKEWGNPKDKAYFDYIKSYSPYDNVKAQHYPHLLVTAGISDPRVTYWEPAKWVAKLRANKLDQNLLLLETNMDTGHAGASGRFGYLREVAKEYNFIFKVFNVRLGTAENR